MVDMAIVQAVVTLIMIVVEVALLAGLIVLVVEMLNAGRSGACVIPIRARPQSLRIMEEASVMTTEPVHPKPTAVHWHERGQHAVRRRV